MPTFIRNQILLWKNDREDCAPEAALTTSQKSTKRGAPRLLNYIKHNKYAELNPDCFSKLFLVALGNRTNIRKEGFLIPEVKAGLQELVSDTAADEVIVVTDSMNRRNWLDSYRPVAKIARTIEVKSTASVEA